MKIISSYGEIRRYTEKQWVDWLKAVAAGDHNKAQEIALKAKYLGTIHAETADIYPCDAQERLQEGR